MKRKICIILALTLLLSFAAMACATEEAKPDPTPAADPTPAPPPPEPPPPPPPAAVPDVFVWNNFADRIPTEDAKPDNSTSGVPIWWNNWANLRASNDNGAVTINYRPGKFDSEDFDDLDDYFSRPGDWMGNFGEAVNMWALEGISYCKYMTIRMAGGLGGEENFLILQFQPEDGPFFAARFADLVTKDGGSPEITTDMQDIVIDLHASGFPGMTNRMHIRAFAECTIILEEISFSEPTGLIDVDSPDSIIAGFSVQPTMNGLGDLPIREWGTFIWNNFIGREPREDAKPDYSTSGVNIWWNNWANLSGEVVDDGVQINFAPRAFDSRDYDDEDEYYESAADWMGNWGEAVNMWAIDGITYCQFITFRMRGLEGGEENKIMLHFQPEDGPSFVARFSDMVALGGGSPEITTTMQDVIIDLGASGFPGMTNRMHIRAFVECSIVLEEIFFSVPSGRLDSDDPVGGITIPEIGSPASLPIREFVAEAS